jgi:hypothetical protein
VTTPTPETFEPAATLSLVRKLLLAALVAGIVGTEVELFLLEHTDGPWQLTPIILLGFSIGVLIWHVLTRSAASVRVLQGTMLLFLVAGVTGVIMHYRGNVEFELERSPGLSGLALFKETMMGATPALAPGAMIQQALVGLAYAFRHPSLPLARSTHNTTKVA